MQTQGLTMELLSQHVHCCPVFQYAVQFWESVPETATRKLFTTLNNDVT